MIKVEDVILYFEKNILEKSDLLKEKKDLVVQAIRAVHDDIMRNLGTMPPLRSIVALALYKATTLTKFEIVTIVGIDRQTLNKYIRKLPIFSSEPFEAV